jgi:predicted Zn-dependent protease
MILKINLSKILLLISSVYYLNLSHAQSNSLVTQTLGTVQTGATPDPNVSIGTLGVGNGKYEEYLSVCRANEYDTVRYYSSDLKKKRSDLLKERINKAGDDSTKMTLRLIKELIDQGETKEARTYIDTLKKNKLSNYENSYLNALVSISTENYTAARDTLTKLLIDDEKNQDLLRLLAEVFTSLQNYYEASTIYEDMNKFTDNSYLIQQCEALILNSLNADGEKVCLKAAKKFPESPLPHIYIGISHRERENYKQALLAFKKAVKIKPTEMGTTCLAEQYFIKQDYVNAVTQFEKSSALNPKSIRAQLGLAWTQIKNKQFAESLNAFKKVCAINSKYQIELRRAFKILSADKLPEAKKFIQAAESCGG